MADNFIGRMLGAIMADTKIIGEIEDQLKGMGEGEFREINCVGVRRDKNGWQVGDK